MSGSFLSRKVDGPVRFQDPSGFSLDGQLESVRLFVPDQGARELVLTVWFEYWTFKRIDRGQLFGYSMDTLVLADGQAFELTSTLPLQFELRAEGAVATALAQFDGEALLDHALAGLRGDGRCAPFIDVANYRYLGVYQQKEMDGQTYLRGADSVFKNQPAS